MFFTFRSMQGSICFERFPTATHLCFPLKFYGNIANIFTQFQTKTFYQLQLSLLFMTLAGLWIGFDHFQIWSTTICNIRIRHSYFVYIYDRQNCRQREYVQSTENLTLSNQEYTLFFYDKFIMSSMNSFEIFLTLTSGQGKDKH